MTPESIVLMPFYMLFPLPATSFLAQSFLGELLFTPFSNLSLKVISIIKPYLTPPPNWLQMLVLWLPSYTCPLMFSFNCELLKGKNCSTHYCSPSCNNHSTWYTVNARCRLNVCLPKIHRLKTNVMVFGGRGFGRWLAVEGRALIWH